VGAVVVGVGFETVVLGAAVVVFVVDVVVVLDVAFVVAASKSCFNRLEAPNLADLLRRAKRPLRSSSLYMSLFLVVVLVE